MTVPIAGGTDFYLRYAEALNAYLRPRDEASLAVGHELGRRALSDRMSMLDIIENHSRLVQATTGTPPDTAAALAVPAADAGGTRRRHPRIPRRHKALRAAAGPRRGPRRPRRVPQRAGELAAGGLLRRRSHRRDRRDQRRVRRHHRLRRGRASVSARRTRGWATNPRRNTRLSALARDGTVAAETSIRHRDGRIRWVAVSINAVTADALRSPRPTSGPSATSPPRAPRRSASGRWRGWPPR